MVKGKNPIAKAMAKWSEQERLRLSMPGHKGSDEILDAISLAMDVTELPGFDCLHAPTGCILESEKKVQSIFGSLASYYLVNGASGGLKAALLSLQGKVDAICLPRTAHRSLWEGCVLAGLEPQIIEPFVWQGLALPPTVDQYRACSASTGVLLSTTYEGIVADYRSMRKEKFWVADEAHGAHLFFLGWPHAMQYADIVVQGAHKTLGSLTQSALLHVQDTESLHLMRSHLSMMQSTSPSWLLLASLEEAVAYWDKLVKTKKIESLLQRLVDLRSSISCIEGFQVVQNPPEGYSIDPLHLLIRVDRKLGGRGLAQILQDDYHMDVEMASPDTLLGLLGPFDALDTDILIVKALQEISGTWALDDAGIGWDSPIRPETVRELSLREAYLSDKEILPLASSVNRLAGDWVGMYPPGIPWLIPGERISQDMVEAVRQASEEKYMMDGLLGNNITVIKE